MIKEFKEFKEFKELSQMLDCRVANNPCQLVN